MNGNHLPRENKNRPSLAETRQNLIELGADNSTLRAVLQESTDPGRAFEDFLVVTKYADHFGKNPNDVYRDPSGVEVSRAFMLSRETDRHVDELSQRALSARALRLIQDTEVTPEASQAAADEKEYVGASSIDPAVARRIAEELSIPVGKYKDRRNE